MLVASVIVDVAARAVDKPFSYLVDPQLAPAVQIGCAVSVDFANRPVVGYIIGLAEMSKDEYEESIGDIAKLKPLLGILSEPYFDEVAARLAAWISHEYLCTMSDALHLFTPPGGSPKVKRVDGNWELVFSGVGPVDDRWVIPTDAAVSFVPAKTAAKQRRVLEALSCGEMRVAELTAMLGEVNSPLKALERHGVVRIEHRRRIRDAMPATRAACTSVASLTQGQQEALDVIRATIAGDAPSNVVVVDGITGSGKTEVYLRAIADVLGAGKSAIMLVPEIALTPQTVGRFRSRFGDDVAVLHSRLSTGERFDQWDIVRRGQAHVVVGTRSALFAPVHDLGLVIIDEEHDSSYKQDSSPRHDARAVAYELTRMRGATLVLGSATPSIDTLASCEGGVLGERAWQHVALLERPSGQPLPDVQIVDMAAEFKGGSRSMFSQALVDALLGVHERGEKAVLLLNRRGFASFVLCRECGYVPECPHCSTSLTFHDATGELVCHHCDHVEPMPATCPQCGSPYLRKFGAGTERVEAELRQIVPADMPIIRMDADTTRKKGSHERLLEEFSSAHGGILLGTQMIAKGLDFPDVTLVGVINADTTLKLPDFRAPERTFQLLEQVSGRAGRADKPGHVIVQTYWPEHPAIRAAAAHDRALFLERELPLRDELAYPPYVRLVNVLAWGQDDNAVHQAITELTLAINSAMISAGCEWEVLGPAPCLFSRLRGLYRWHTLIKAPVGADASAVIEPVLKARKPNAEVRIAVDVDPDNLF